MEKIMHELSNPQKNIWTMEQFYRGSNINNICGTLTMKEDINLHKLNIAVNKFVQNNKSFGLNFDIKDGQIKQYFVEQENEEYEKVYLKDYSEVHELATKISEQVFNIEDKKLYKFVLFKLENGNGGFIVMTHHIISDAATFSLIGTEIVENYAKILKNEEIEKKDYSYEDYLQDEKYYLNSDKFLKDKEYWNSLYETVPEVASVPSLKKTIGIELSGKAKRKEFIIEKELLKRISDFCTKNRVSNFNFFMAIYAIYIGRVSNLNEFVIGTPILNRTNFKEKHTTGMFINTAPMKIKLEPENDFTTFVKQIAKDSMSMLRFQKYPYEMLLEDLRKKQSNLPALFDVMLSYQITKANDRNIEIPYEVEWLPTSTISNGMYIHLHDNNDDESLNIAYDYKIAKYDEMDIIDMHNRILHIINQILKKGDFLEKDIKIVTPDEEHEMLNKFNRKIEILEFDKYQNIIEMIEKNSLKNSDNIAIEDDKNKITYKELLERVNKLVNYLSSRDINSGNNIGILVNKTIDTIIGILAIIKMNCTIVPIDPNYPEERILYMLEKSKINKLLINNIDYENDKLDIKNIEYKNYINESSKIKDKFNYNKDNNLYIIFTSGSTGKPKGATITHKNMINLMLAQNEKGNVVTSESKILQFATMSFDVSYQEIFTAFTNGATLVLIDDERKKDSAKLVEYISKKNIDVLFIPPRYLQLLSDGNNDNRFSLKNVKNIITAGEQLIITKNIEQLVKNGIKIHNHYGPAETHVCTINIIDDIEKVELKPAIGKPILNSYIYILDENRNIVPIGTVGEIYISGYCVGNGYINDEIMTKERFIKDPFNKGQIMYKTGDLGKYDKNGDIYYIGRKDFQVKVNGYRIELEEIEKHMSKIPYIDSCFVTVEKNELEKNILMAFVKLKDNSNGQELKKELQKVLPKYMIPSILYKMKKVPLNNNGKIDKRYILNNKNKFEIISSNSEKIEASTNLEKELLELFRKVLNNKKIYANDDFFEFGGDSLTAIALQAQCVKKGIFFNTQELYDNPTVIEISKHLELKTTNKLDDSNIKIEKTNKLVKINKINNVLITGTTGFLGIHVLNKMLINTNNNIYCIVRSKQGKTASQRLTELYRYYFDEDISKYFGSRICIIDGELSKAFFGMKKKDYNELCAKTDITINCAASVKHYTTRKYNYTSNVITTQNLIDFIEKSNSLLNHISTIGVAGNDLVNTNNCVKHEFSEDDFYIGQDYKSNVYIETKFEAEKIIVENINEGRINANIIRVGNLTNRFSDNKFQVNKETNAFQNKIKAISKLKIVPDEFIKFKYDLTPVDYCAEAIVLLSLYERYDNVYHVVNANQIDFEMIKNILKNFGIEMQILSTNKIIEIFNDKEYALDENSIQWIVNDIVLHNNRRIIVKSEKTQKILEKLGFSWKNNWKNYYEKVFKYILEGDV